MNKPFLGKEGTLALMQVLKNSMGQIGSGGVTPDSVRFDVDSTTGNLVMISSAEFTNLRLEDGYLILGGTNGGLGVVPRGSYDAEAQYDAGDLVEHQGSSYFVLQEVAGVEPTNDNINYMLLVSKGADGKDGSPGRDGVDGQDGADGAPGKDGKNGKDGVDGITSFNGRTGAISPQDGDYTPTMVGADPSGSASAVEASLNAHKSANNPHGITAAMIGAVTTGQMNSAIQDAISQTWEGSY